jgi:hypothetical protein
LKEVLGKVSTRNKKKKTRQQERFLNATSREKLRAKYVIDLKSKKCRCAKSQKEVAAFSSTKV